MYDVVTVSGRPFERGRQHGIAAATKVRANVETTYQRLAVIGVTDRASVRGLRASLDEAVDRYAPALREEIEGIATGAGLAADDVLTLNSYPDLGIGTGILHSCTTAIVRDTSASETLLWQNNDACVGYTSGMIVLHVHGGSISHTQFTYAGVVGESGMNSAGLAIAGNGLNTVHSRAGVPFLVLMRIILDSCTTVDEVIDTVKAHPRAFGMTYAVADARGSAVYIEASAHAVHTTPVHAWATHANHCLAPEVAATEVLVTEGHKNSEERMASVEEQLRAVDQPSLSTLQEIARSHNGVCQHRNTKGFNGHVESLYGFIAAPASRRLWLASGSPCSNRFEVVEPAWTTTNL